MSKVIMLPSGATLKITLAPFGDAKALYQAMLKELQVTKFSSDVDVSSFMKDAFCIGLSSPAIDKALATCMRRATIDYGSGDEKITDDTFEPEENRGDYVKVLMEVGRANVSPFLKSLYADFKSALSQMTEGTQKSPSKTTP